MNEIVVWKYVALSKTIIRNGTRRTYKRSMFLLNVGWRQQVYADLAPGDSPFEIHRCQNIETNIVQWLSGTGAVTLSLWKFIRS
jgi:hypothetical protein